jgi:hypothetical protein
VGGEGLDGDVVDEEFAGGGSGAGGAGDDELVELGVDDGRIRR